MVFSKLAEGFEEVGGEGSGIDSCVEHVGDACLEARDVVGASRDKARPDGFEAAAGMWLVVGVVRVKNYGGGVAYTFSPVGPDRRGLVYSDYSCDSMPLK